MTAGFNERMEHLIRTAADFGYTREQVLAWTRPDLLAFIDQLNARTAVQEAQLAFLKQQTTHPANRLGRPN